MARPRNRIISEEEFEQLKINIKAMEKSFSGEWISGKKLHLIKRYGDEKGYKEILKRTHPVLYKALWEENILPSGRMLSKYLEGEMPRKTVEQLAEFCTKVFAFPNTITAEDLMTKNLSPFPPMRKKAGLWGRYVGTYYCYYQDPGVPEQDLHCALLQLDDADGDLKCRMVIGIRDEYCLNQAEELLMKIRSAKGYVHALDLLNQEDRNQSTQMYYYEGTIDDRTVPEYYLIQLRRHESQHAMTVYLRSWSQSKKAEYAGGIATVLRCRKDEILSYPMILTRRKLSPLKHRDFLLSYLSGAVEEDGIKETKSMDEQFDKDIRIIYP